MEKEYEMTKQEMDDIIAINNERIPVMKFGDYWSGMNKQEKANKYWEGMSKKYGFKTMSVKPHPNGNPLCFIAEPSV